MNFIVVESGKVKQMRVKNSYQQGVFDGMKIAKDNENVEKVLASFIVTLHDCCRTPIEDIKGIMEMVQDIWFDDVNGKVDVRTLCYEKTGIAMGRYR